MQIWGKSPLGSGNIKRQNPDWQGLWRPIWLQLKQQEGATGDGDRGWAGPCEGINFHSGWGRAGARLWADEWLEPRTQESPRLPRWEMMGQRQKWRREDQRKLYCDPAGDPDGSSGGSSGDGAGFWNSNNTCTKFTSTSDSSQSYPWINSFNSHNNSVRWVPQLTPS